MDTRTKRMSRSIALTLALLLLTSLLAPVAVRAEGTAPNSASAGDWFGAVQRGADWLRQQQRPEGSWGGTADLLPMAFAAKALQANGATDPALQAGVRAYPADDAKSLALRLYGSGDPSLHEPLAALQQADGSWGEVSATAMAVIGLAESGYAGPALAPALSFLAARQNADGGWGAPTSYAKETAWATLALARAGGSAEAAGRGAQWLALHQGRKGDWVYTTDTAIAAIALQQSGGQAEALAKATAYLEDAGNTGGGWGLAERTASDEYATAAALIALQGAAESQARQSGLAYLQARVPGLGAGKGGLAHVATATALRALSAAGDSGAAIGRGLTWLQGQPAPNLDYLAQRLEAEALVAVPPADLISQLVTYRNPDGGFALQRGYQSDVLDTVLALRALQAAGYTDRTVMSGALRFLLSRQNLDGGWNLHRGMASSVWMTAQVVLVFRQDALAGSADAVALARDWLESHQQADGGWGDNGSTLSETALAYGALLRLEHDTAVADRALQYLLSAQRPDGSWEGSPLTTAQVMLALQEAAPNLVVGAGDLTLSAYTPVNGNTVQVTVNVHNYGGSVSDASTLSLYRGDPAAGGELIGEAPVPSLAPGASAQVTLDWNTRGQVGMQRLVAVADSGLTLRESSETDNQTYLDVYVQEASPIVIGNPRPASGGVTNDTTPVIGASFFSSAGADLSTVRIWLDEVEVTASADIRVDGVTYTPPTGLADGSHRVAVEAGDNAGQTARFEWSFIVNRNAGSYVRIYTGTIDMAVDIYGNFTEGSGDFKRLLYGHPSPWSSYLAVMANGQVYSNGAIGRNLSQYITRLTSPEDSDDDGYYDSAVTEWTLPGKVVVTQTLTTIPYAVRYQVAVRNLGTDPQDVRVRYLFDTQMNFNDGAPFYLPGEDLQLTTEREYAPPTFRVWKDYDSFVNPTLVGEGWFHPDAIPDKIQFTYWGGSFYYSAFDYVVNPNRGVTSDSAVLMYWDMGALTPGAAETITTFYGLNRASEILSPDVKVEGAGIQFAADPQVGVENTLTATIENVGQADAENVTVAVFDGPPELGGTMLGEIITLPLLAQGATEQISVPWTPVGAGAHTIYVVVDIDNGISELDETNNQAFRTVDVAPNVLPDLAVSAADLVILPAAPVEGDMVTITAGVTNPGGSPVQSAVVRFYDGDPAAGGQQIGEDQPVVNLLPNARQQVQIEWSTVGLSGAHVICVVADPADDLMETSEENNQASASVTLTPLGLTAAISTDQPEYGPNSPVQIHVALTETAQVQRDLTYEVTVTDEAGVLVTSLGTQPVTVAGGAMAEADHTWNTGATLAGNYLARLQVFAGDRLVAAAEAPFRVVAAETLETTLRLNQTEYAIGETVTMQSRLVNTSPNYLFEGLTVTIEVRNAAGELLYTAEHPVTALVPGADARFTDSWPTDGQPPGTYEVRLTVRRGAEVLDEQTQTFAIAGMGRLTGQLTVPATLVRGQDLPVTVDLRNDGTAPVSGEVEVLVAILSDPGAEPFARQTLTVALAPGGAVSQTLTFPALDAPEGEYLVVLRPTEPDAQALDAEPVTVIRLLDLSTRVVTGHRALVWVRGTAETTFYTNLLGGMGIPYTMVADRNAFIQELRSDRYDLYVMGDISHHLKEDYDQELLERIYSGAGLMATLGAAGDDLKVSGLFGFDYRGVLSGDYSVQSAGSTFTTQSSLVKANATWGQTLATMTSLKNGESWPAVIGNPYGNGQVNYFAFNPALIQGAGAGAARQMAIDALNRVAPPLTVPSRAGQVVTVELTLASLGVPADLQVTLTLPSGWTWADSDPAQPTRTWEVALAAGETRTLTYQVRLPDTTEPANLMALISYRRDGQWLPYAEVPLTLQVTDGMTQLRPRIDAAFAALRAQLADGTDLQRLDQIEAEVRAILNRQPTTGGDLEFDIHRLTGVFESMDRLPQLAATRTLHLELDRLLALLESNWFYGGSGQ